MRKCLKAGPIEEESGSEDRVRGKIIVLDAGMAVDLKILEITLSTIL